MKLTDLFEKPETLKLPDLSVDDELMVDIKPNLR